MLDLRPATRVLTELIEALEDSDDQRGAPTPCADRSLGDLLDHVDGLALAFTAAATKEWPPDGSQGPSADGSRLGQDWRPRITGRLAALAEAWRDETAWTGMTRAGGVDMPGDVAGLVALDEVVVHGWDIAVATGQRFTCEAGLLEATYGFVRASVDENPQGTPGLFGPPVPVDENAPVLDRLVGLTGRDPSWRVVEG